MKKEKITIAFASVIEALFLLLEIYFMIHAKGNFPVLLIVAICMVAVLFFLVLSIIELSQKNKEKERLDYEEIYKAQKASYLAQRKYFDELNERLNQLEENTNFPAEDIITAQKAVAKVTISRSKENADALMNANDELIQRVFGFEEKLADNNDALLRQQETLLQQTREELVANNQGMQDQFAALHQALEQMKQEITDIRYPLHKAKIKMINLCSALFRRFGEIYVSDTAEDMESRFYLRISQSTTLYSLFQVCREMIDETNQVISGRLEKHDLVDQISRYISANYQSNITLQDIADQIHISSAYVSRLFRNKTGITITEAINRARIDQAKLLLGNPEYKVYEIAQMVGFEDAAYFTSVFTKYVGCSPSEYRSQK